MINCLPNDSQKDYLTAAEGSLVVAAAQVPRLLGDAVVHVLCEAVQHADGLLAHTNVWMNLLQHSVQVYLHGGDISIVSAWSRHEHVLNVLGKASQHTACLLAFNRVRVDLSRQMYLHRVHRQVLVACQVSLVALVDNRTAHEAQAYPKGSKTSYESKGPQRGLHAC